MRNTLYKFEKQIAKAVIPFWVTCLFFVFSGITSGITIFSDCIRAFCTLLDNENRQVFDKWLFILLSWMVWNRLRHLFTCLGGKW